MSARSRSRIHPARMDGIETIAAMRIRRPCNRSFFKSGLTGQWKNDPAEYLKSL